MPDEKMSELASASTIADADLFETVQGGTNKKASASLFKAYLGLLIGVPIVFMPTGADISSNQYPSTGGTGPAGVPGAGNIFFVSVPGTLDGVFVPIGSLLLSFITTPGQVDTNWRII